MHPACLTSSKGALPVYYTRQFIYIDLATFMIATVIKWITLNFL